MQLRNRHNCSKALEMHFHFGSIDDYKHNRQSVLIAYFFYFCLHISISIFINGKTQWTQFKNRENDDALKQPTINCLLFTEHIYSIEMQSKWELCDKTIARLVIVIEYLALQHLLADFWTLLIANLWEIKSFTHSGAAFNYKKIHFCKLWPTRVILWRKLSWTVFCWLFSF